MQHGVGFAQLGDVPTHTTAGYARNRNYLLFLLTTASLTTMGETDPLLGHACETLWGYLRLYR